MKEKARATWPGVTMLVFWLLMILAGILVMVSGFRADRAMEGRGLLILFGVVIVTGALISLGGLFGIQPNQAVVLTLFGRYMGTVNPEGLHWVNPFLAKKRISLRVRNFETKLLKVNDHDGNPIEIAAVVVWKVVDTAEALFQVENFEHYVGIQSEAALRNMSTAYSYDAHDAGKMSLRANAMEIAAHLRDEIQDRLRVTGVEVIESRISHLAFAPEIAAVMLQRQQASAIIAARQKIVEGAVGMVHMALEALAEKGAVTLDEERKSSDGEQSVGDPVRGPRGAADRERRHHVPLVVFRGVFRGHSGVSPVSPGRQG
jgi:regulator of protease activity HflC (stomatin/prohibitin superfamily)